MSRTIDHDLALLAGRLRLGLPLRGFDGRDIPLHDRHGRETDPIDAGYALLLSAASRLPSSEGDAFVDLAIARAQGVEAASIAAGDRAPMVAAKVTAVLVSAAVRATVLAEGRDVSPGAINRATLAWYQVHDLRWRELLEASLDAGERSLTA